ncbi:MAG: alpha/beta hydrolase [Pseudobdellovibrio sp.]
MKQFLSLVFTFYVFTSVGVTQAFAAPADSIPSEGYVDVGPKQRIAYDSAIVDSSKATLVLLPGVFRGLNRTDAFIKLLVEKKINFVSLHFSTQPASIVNYEKNKKTYFENGENVTSESLAQEVEILVTTLKIRKPLIVSLSYSGSVIQYLNPKTFPVVIETAPIGRFDEDASDAAIAFKAWEQWIKNFPGGAAIAQAAKDSAFKKYWGDVALQYSGTDERLKSQENIDRMTDGYMGMAKAVEEYDMRLQNFETSPRRVFILGENEDAKRSAIQLEAIENYKKITGIKAEPIIIKGAGHIVPNDRPESYVEILSAILNTFDKKY